MGQENGCVEDAVSRASGSPLGADGLVCRMDERDGVGGAPSLSTLPVRHLRQDRQVPVVGRDDAKSWCVGLASETI